MLLTRGAPSGVPVFVQGHLLVAVQEYARLLTVLLRDNNKTVPQILRENRGVLCDMTVIAAGGGGVLVAGKLWVASLGAWSSLGLAAGFVSMPLWVPISGGLIGVSAAVLGLRCVLANLDSKEQMAVFRLAYHCNHLMMAADRRLSRAEKDHLEDVVIRSGLSADVVKEIESDAPKFVPELSVPEGISEQYRYAILVGCWQIAFCDGIHPSEERVFRKLCLKFGLIDRAEEIKAGAEKTSERNAKLWEAMTIATRGMAGSDLVLSESMLNSLLALNPREDAKERLRQTATVATTIAAASASIGALVSGRPELLRVIAQGYTMCLGFLVAPGHKDLEEARGNALKMADALKIPRPEAEKTLKQIESGIYKAIDDARKQSTDNRDLA